jgi:hypothetical protein
MNSFSTSVFGTFKIGYELLIYNGLLTFLGLWLISRKDESVKLKEHSKLEEARY